MLLRKYAPIEEIDYIYLMSLLKGYRYPRNKISSLIQKGVLIRVKKGLYVFGKNYSLMPYSRETLANLIYGPSYISLEYALAFYGLIPERVEMVTSITPTRNKFFKTPVGNFSYKYLNKEKYSIGITLYPQDEFHHILMATKEKAIIDKLYFSSKLEDLDDLKTFLFEDLRIEPESFLDFDASLVERIGQKYKHSNVSLFLKFIREEI